MRLNLAKIHLLELTKNSRIIFQEKLIVDTNLIMLDAK